MKQAPEGKHAWTATVGTKGQIVIPREARELFDIQPGDTLQLNTSVTTKTDGQVYVNKLITWLHEPDQNIDCHQLHIQTC